MSAARKDWRPYGAMGLGVLFIGMSALFVKWAGQAGVPGPVSAFYRLAMASVLLLPMWGWRLRGGQIPGQGSAVFGVFCGLLFASDIACWNISVMLIPAADATLLANTAPIWVGLASWLIFRRRLGQLYWWGMVLAVIGCWLLLGRGAPRLHLGLGGLLGMAAGLFYAAYILATPRARQSLDTFGFMTLSTAGGALALLLLCLMLRLPLHGFPLRAWLAMAALGLLTHFCGWLLANYGLGHIPAPIAAVILMGQAPITALLAIPFLGETLGLVQTLGGLLILLGIYLVNRRGE
nr:EamA family transporter [uncultured Holophaga sp.]